MSAEQCWKCGYRVADDIEELPSSEFIEADPPTDPYQPARPPLPRAQPARATRRRGGYGWLVLVALFEWLSGSALLLAGLRLRRIIPETAREPPEVVPWLAKLTADVPGREISVMAAGVLSTGLGAFLLARKRWSWVASLLVCAGWGAAGYFLGDHSVTPRNAALVAPGALGILALLLGWAAPRSSIR
jgi:hypothetical protein